MALTAKKVYAILKRQISDMEAKLNSPVRYRGTVATADLLPLNPDIGDMYNIESKSIYGEAGMNVAWNGVVWDTMGAPIDMSLYLTKEEAESVIQRLVTEYFEKNPVKPGATTEQAQQIEQNKTDIASLKTETSSLKEDLSEIKTYLGSNLIPKTLTIWQLTNTLAVFNTSTSSYTDGVSRMSLKPINWIKLEVGKKYKFYHDSSEYKIACNTHNGTTVNKDSGWILKDEVYEFTPVSGYNMATLVIARTDDGIIKMADLLESLPNIVLCEYDTNIENIKYEDSGIHKLLYLDKTKTVQGLSGSVDTNWNLVISQSLYRATYSTIIDVKNVDYISIDGEMLKNYDVSIITFNENRLKVDYGWGSSRKITLLPYTVCIAVNFREKTNGFINSNCLLYNNDFCIGLGMDAVVTPTSKNIHKIYKQNKVNHIAHRGYQTKATENSIPSFEEACKNGFDGVETDIQMSADGTLYCMHDDSVDRTTNGTGKIYELRDTYINSLVINHTSEYTDLEMRVPKFTDYLIICKKYGRIPIIELKTNGMNAEGLQTMINSLNTYGLLERCVIIGFSMDLLSELRKMNDMIYIEPLIDVNHINILRASAFGNSGINSGYSNISDYSVKDAHSLGLNVSANVVPTQEICDSLISKGCDNIISNEYFGISSNPL